MIVEFSVFVGKGLFFHRFITFVVASHVKSTVNRCLSNRRARRDEINKWRKCFNVF